MNTSDIQQSPSRRGSGWRGLARAGLALALLAMLGTSVVQDVGGSLSGPLVGLRQLVAATRVVAAPNATDTDAIQQVIQRSNDEQVQAIANQDPTAMSDTVTPEHFQQLQQVNQDLLNQGVTSIALVGLDWGPITVNGSTATATSYETWSTTFRDSSTALSRDQNDYTLVQAADGSWKIQSDDHPQGSPNQPATSSSPPSRPGGDPAPLGQPDSRGVSHNWAGYAASGGSYTDVSGTWTVPTFAPDSPQGVDATWVGIGGVTSHDLIQAGTQEVTSGTGQTQYQAWIELLPAASRPVPLVVHPGDSVSVSIDRQAGNNWLISFTNNTTGQNLQQPVRYASSLSSAEWIEEAPSTFRGGILPLDNFGTLAFTDGSTVKDGQTDTIAAAGGQPISLIGADQQALAVPSSLAGDGASFSVSRTANAVTTGRPGVGTRPRRSLGG
jgi:peptidase A4-like protein